MEIDFDLDTRNLEQLFRNLSLKRQQRLIYNSLKKIAGRTRKLVQQEAARSFATRLRAGKPRKKGGGRAWGRKSSPRKDVAKGIQSMVYPRKIGFRIHISPNDHKTMHTNRQKLPKPVLFWRNGGTGVRISGTKKMGAKARGNRGAMPGIPFMKSAGAQYDSSTVAEFEKILITSINKTSRKYGARLT